MGDNQLSILIQAKIDEASTKTMQDQLTALAKNLKAVKISLDLGDVKAQFANMFKEIERESQKQKRKASGLTASKSGNETFTGTQSEAMRKAVIHAEGLNKNLQDVRNIVKDMGNLTNLKEEFSSADGSLVKMKATIEEVDGTLKQIKNVEVFKTINKETGEAEYQMGKIAVQTKEFGMSMQQLQEAGKGKLYQKLYQSIEQYINGGIEAKKVAEDLHEAIYTKKGDERDFFKKLDPSVKTEYLKALTQAQTNHMDAMHTEALKMNEDYNNRQQELQALADKVEKDNAQRAIAQQEEKAKREEAIAKQRLENRKSDFMEALRVQQEEIDIQKQVDAIEKANEEKRLADKLALEKQAQKESEAIQKERISQKKADILEALKADNKSEKMFYSLEDNRKKEQAALEAEQTKAINKALTEQFELKQKTLALDEKIQSAQKNVAQEATNLKNKYGNFVNVDELDKVEEGFNNLSVDTKELTTDLGAVEKELKALEKAYSQIEKEAKSAMEVSEKLKARAKDKNDTEALKAMYKQEENIKKAQAKSDEAKLKEMYKTEEEIAKKKVNMIDFEIEKREASAKSFAQSLKFQMEQAARAEQQSIEIAQYKEKMTKKISDLESTSKIGDTNKLKALKKSLEVLSVESQDVSNQMNNMSKEFDLIAQGSVKITNVTSGMSQLETEIVTINEQLKTGKMTLEQYVTALRRVMKNQDGSYKTELNDIDVNSKIRYIQQLAQAQAQVEANEEKHNEELQKKQTFYTQIESQVRKLNELTSNGAKHDESQYSKLKSEYEKLTSAVKDGNMTLTQAKSKYQELGIQMKQFENETKSLNESTGKLGNAIKQAIGIFSLYDMFELGKNVVRGMINEVNVLDASLVEMNKVAGLSDKQLDGFLSRAYEVADGVGRLGSDVVDATGDFVKMGESVEDALKLAQNALLYVNVGDGVSVDDATSTLISAMKAFNIQAGSSLDIVDKMNNMANNFAITTAGLGDGLRLASSALAAANNDIDETLALMSVGNQVTQQPEMVANGLRTISMRLRGLKDDEGELVSNMEEIFDTYARGIKIINDDGSFKSTFQILNELGEIWDTLTDKQQAFLAEKIAGKHRANIFLSIMENAEDLNDALETSQNSFNSAMIENERFMDSIEGKTQQLKSAWQELSTTFISSDFVKGVIEALTGLVKLATDFDVLKIAIIGVTGALVAMNYANIASTFTKLISIIPAVISYLDGVYIAIKSVTLGTVSFRNALLSLNINPVMLAITGVTAAIAGFVMASDRAKKKSQELAEATRQLSEESKNELKTIEDLTERYENSIDPFTGVIKNKQELIAIQKQLKDSFGSEADGIDVLNGKYQETIDKLNELTLAKLKQNEVFLRDAYQQAQEEADDILGKSGNGLGEIRFTFNDSDTREVVAKAAEKLKAEFDGAIDIGDIVGENFLKIDTSDINVAKDALTRLMEVLQSNDVSRSDETYKSILSTLLKVTTASDNLSNAQDNLYSSLAKTAAQTAMQKAGCDVLTRATDEQVKSIKQYVGELEKSDPLLAQYVQKLLEASNPTFVEQTVANAEAYKVFAEAIAATQDAYAAVRGDIDELDEAINTLTNDKMLSGETINKLIDKYGELQNSLTLTDKGYTLSKEALIALRQAKVDEANTTAQTQKSDVQNVLNGVRARLAAYKQEVSTIKTVAQAQQALAGAKVKASQTNTQIDTMIEDRVNSIGNGTALLKGNSGVINSLKLEALKQQQEQQKQIVSEYEVLAEGLKTIEELEKSIQAENIVNTNAFIAATTPSETKKDKSDKKKSYIAEELDVLINDILSSTDKLEYAIELANEKLTNAQNKGDLKAQSAIKQQIIDLIKQRKVETEKQAKQLRAEGEKMVAVLSDTGLFKGVDLKNLTEKQLSDVSKSLERTIADATDSQAEDLELLKAKVEEYGNAIIRIYKDELPNLSKAWWEIQNEHIDKLKEAIEDVYNLAKRKINNSTRDAELEQILLNENSQEYIELEKKKYANVLALQEEARQALKKIKEEDKNLEGEMAQKYLDIWYDAEKQKREMIKAFAEKAKQDREKEIEETTESMKKAKDALETLLETTMKMLKQEANDRKSALKDELDAYKKLIDAKKESLKADKQARDDAKNLKKKQTAVAKIEAQIAELQFDTSAAAAAKRLELEEKLAEAREELEDFQYEQSIEKQEEALDEEYAAFKELIDKQIKDIEDYLSKEGNLRAEALKIIEANNEELYEKLIKWNEDYGTGISSDISNAWELAHEAMKEYNNGQLDVLGTLEKITNEMEKIKLEKENLKVEDFYDREDGGMMGDIQPNPDTPSENHGDVITEEEAKKKIRENQQKYLHDKAVEAKTNGNASLLKWVQEERKKWGFDQTSGASLKGYETFVPPEAWEKYKKQYNIYHTGGFVGNLNSNEEFAKLLKGEYVATEAQMNSFMQKTLPTLVGSSTGSQELNFENLINLKVEGNLDSSVIPELENVVKKAIDGAIGKINDTMSNRGFRRTGMSLGI